MILALLAFPSKHVLNYLISTLLNLNLSTTTIQILFRKSIVWLHETHLGVIDITPIELCIVLWNKFALHSLNLYWYVWAAQWNDLLTDPNNILTPLIFSKKMILDSVKSV